VEAIFSSEVDEILLGAVRLKTSAGTRTVPNDYVFVFAGGDPPFALLKQMGVRFGGEAGAPARPGAGRPASPGPGAVRATEGTL
jgi:thioredoxin reductase